MDISRTYVYAFHIVILSVVAVIGSMGRKTPKWMFAVLLGVAIVGILYHAFKLYDSVSENDEGNVSTA